MKEDTIQRIRSLNAEFYQTFASQFSETRMRIQPGVRKLLPRISLDAWVLDLGCGNGELAYQMALQGFRGEYYGVDLTQGLLEIAQTRLAGNPKFHFLCADLAEPEWVNLLPDAKFDFALAFAVLHHIPGKKIRHRFLLQVREKLILGGKFFFSTWQFLNSERLRDRIQPWNIVSIEKEEVDLGDYILDWRHGGTGLRYVHHFQQSELISLAKGSQFKVLETFCSDGEGGNLGLYQVWEAI